MERNYLRKALDKFAHFFTAPLLQKDWVDQEIQAVDSGMSVDFLPKHVCLAGDIACLMLCKQVLLLKRKLRKNSS